jgi:Fic family protein
MDFSNLDLLKEKLDQYKPLPKALVRNLHEDLVLRWTYHSNAIEGNTLTLKETKVALEGITVGGKTLREHFEAINHRDAIFFVEELVRKQEIFSEWQIKNIHQLILKNIDNENAGRYRTINVTIAGAQHLPPDFLQVSQLMENFIHWYQASKLHPVERAARVHCDFVKIHPFTDGNGRTARLLMNMELMKSGFPAVVLPVEHRLAYYETLDKAHAEGDYVPFISLISEMVVLGFVPYWHALGIKSS